MYKRRIQQILEKIAIRNNTTADEVRRDIEIAMKAGQSSPDPIVQARWNAIPRKGTELTVEEFILFVAQEATSNLL